MKRLKLIMILIVISIILSGCSYTELNKLAIVSSLGIDYKESNKENGGRWGTGAALTFNFSKIGDEELHMGYMSKEEFHEKWRKRCKRNVREGIRQQALNILIIVNPPCMPANARSERRIARACP